MRSGRWVPSTGPWSSCITLPIFRWTRFRPFWTFLLGRWSPGCPGRGPRWPPRSARHRRWTMPGLDGELAELRDDLREVVRQPEVGAVIERSRQARARRRTQLGAALAV